MGMAANVNKEFIRCSICNKVVPKQRYCPKCGKLLIKNMKNSPSKEEETDMEKATLKKLVEEVETSPTEQLENLRQKIKSSENERREIIDNESIENDLLIGVEKDGVVIAGEGPLASTIESDMIGGENLVFTPDKYTLETVQKIAKNVKYESYLVKLLKDAEITEEIFLGLYNGIADDTHKLILRRGEIIAEIETAMKGYRSTIVSAQQGMKLLNIRRSIDDASEEEYRVKAAALKWDIDNYTNRINEEEQKATYLKNLGRLIDTKELEELTNDANNCMNVLSKLSVSDVLKGKIKNSMQEALSLIRETNGP